MSSFEYASNSTMTHLAGRITSARKVLVTSHEKPDGDAIGSACGATPNRSPHPRPVFINRYLEASDYQVDLT